MCRCCQVHQPERLLGKRVKKKTSGKPESSCNYSMVIPGIEKSIRKCSQSRIWHIQYNLLLPDLIWVMFWGYKTCCRRPTRDGWWWYHLIHQLASYQGGTTLVLTPCLFDGILSFFRKYRMKWPFPFCLYLSSQQRVCLRVRVSEFDLSSFVLHVIKCNTFLKTYIVACI